MRRWYWAAVPLAGLAMTALPPMATAWPAPGSPSSTTGMLSGTSILSVRRVPDWVESTVAVQRLQSDVGAVASGALDGPSQPSGCVLISSLDGAPLYALDPAGEYIPASNLKILTATAALDRLGPSDRLTTTVRAEQAPENGVVYGNLYLVGGGDPLLRTTSYAAALGPSETLYTSLDQLARQVRQAGIKLVTGDIVGDDGRYDSQRTVATWKPVYSTEGDVGPLSALDVNDGFVPKPPPTTTTTLPPRPGTLPPRPGTLPPRPGTLPPRPGRLPPRPGPTTTTTSPPETSTAAAFAYAAASDPAATAAAAFAILLRQEGVQVDGAAVSGTTPSAAPSVTFIPGAPLGQQIDNMLSVSDDTAAELLTKEIGFRVSKSGTTAAGTAAVRADLAEDGLPVAQLVNVDGSGLDRGDRASCNLLDAALRRGGPAGVIAEGLPVAGKTGTLVDRFLGSPAVGRIRAKTGTLDEVASLSGFLYPASKSASAPELAQPIVFSIIVNGLYYGDAQSLIDRMAVAMAAYPDVPAITAVEPHS